MKKTFIKFLSFALVCAIIFPSCFAEEITANNQSYIFEAENYSQSSGGNVTFDVNTEYGGWYYLTLRYAAKAVTLPGNYSIGVSVNNTPYSFDFVSMDTNWQEAVISVKLMGSNDVIAFSNDDIVIDNIKLEKADSVRLESEKDAQIDTTSTWQIKNSNNEIIAYRGAHTFKINCDKGTYNLSVRWLNATWDSSHYITISVNGVQKAYKGAYNVGTPSENNLGVFSMDVDLIDGENTIFLTSTANKDELYVDYIDLRKNPSYLPKTTYAGNIGTNNVTNGYYGLNSYGQTYLGKYDTNPTYCAPYIDNLGYFIKFPFNVEKAGDYYMKVYYASNNDISDAVVYIDDPRTLSTATADSNSAARLANVEVSQGVLIKSLGKTFSNGKWVKSAAKLDANVSYWKSPYFNMKVIKLTDLEAGDHTALFLAEYLRGNDKVQNNNKNLAVNRIEIISAEFPEKVGLIYNNLTSYAMKNSESGAYSSYISDIAEARTISAQSDNEEDKNIIHVTTQIYNTKNTQVNANLILATYKDGALENICVSPAKAISGGEDYSFDEKIKVTDDTTSVKAYLWYANTIIPIDDSSLILSGNCL